MRKALTSEAVSIMKMVPRILLFVSQYSASYLVRPRAVHSDQYLLKITSNALVDPTQRDKKVILDCYRSSE